MSCLTCLEKVLHLGFPQVEHLFANRRGTRACASRLMDCLPRWQPDRLKSFHGGDNYCNVIAATVLFGGINQSLSGKLFGVSFEVDRDFIMGDFFGQTIATE